MSQNDLTPGVLFSLKGKTALVTGAASGLGLHFVRTLAAAGATVMLTARNAERLHSATEALNLRGVAAHPVTLDVTQRASVDRAIATVEKDIGPIDILVNNAGIADTQPFLTMTEEAWLRVIDTDLSSVWRVSQVVARRMIAHKTRGSIINIASILGLAAQATQSNYATAKAGVIHLTRNLARELWREGIRVNAIAPGYFVTELNRDFFAGEKGQAYIKRLLPRRTGELAELSGPLLLLASEAGSYMTGVTLTVDGGTLLAGI